MFRFKSDAPPAGAPPMMAGAPPPDDETTEPTPDDEQSEGEPMADDSIKKVDPSIAVYRDPTMGPFICSNCFHFDGQGGCNIVGGSIDPNGVCNLFTSNSAQGEEGPTDQADASAEEAEGAGPNGAVPPPPPGPQQ